MVRSTRSAAPVFPRLAVCNHAGRWHLLGPALAIVTASVGCRAEYLVDLDAGATGNSSSSEEPDTDSSSSISDDPSSSTTISNTTTTATESQTSATTSPDSSSTATTSGSDSTTSETDDTTTVDEFCTQAPISPVCDSEADNVTRAMELGCANDPEGVAVLTFTEHNGMIDTHRVATYYGNANWLPRQGMAFLMMSTGSIPAADGDRRVHIPVGHVDDGAGNNLNMSGIDGLQIVPQPGSQKGLGGKPFNNCDGIGDCSDSLSKVIVDGSELRNTQAIRFEIKVPPGVHTFSVDFALFSAEYPRRLDTNEQTDDLFALWVKGRAYTGNFAVIEDALPVTPRNLARKRRSKLAMGETAMLKSTGFEGLSLESCVADGKEFERCPLGIGTPWWTATAPVRPGDTIEVAALLADRVDPDYDSIVLLDNWRWGCEACDWYQDCGVHEP